MDELRGNVVKQEQAQMRELIENAEAEGVRPEERAAAMFMEADTFLRSRGIVAKQVDDA